MVGQARTSALIVDIKMTLPFFRGQFSVLCMGLLVIKAAKGEQKTAQI